MINSKKYLIELLDFCKYKIENDMCNIDEMNSVAKVLEENMQLNGTISDFSKFYGVPEQTIRTTIFKKLFAKPKRVLLYPFHAFSKIVPDKWHKNK